MSHNTFFKEEMELDQIRESEQQLAKRARESAEHRRRLAEERSERETTMPPLEEIQVRMLRKQHEQIVSRGEVKNERRTQNHSILLLLLLVTATCTLVWWGMKLMQGG
jgi:hypothetical protein